MKSSDALAYLAQCAANPAMAGRVPAGKVRAKRFTGKVSQYKEWRLAMQTLPGVFVPIKTVSEANQRCHWAVKAARANAQRLAVGLAMFRRFDWTLPAKVRLTRYGVRLLDQGDNLGSAMKAIRDEISKMFGVDDSPGSPLQFEYAQEACGHYGVRIERVD